MIRTEKKNSADLSSIDKKLKEGYSRAFFGADKKLKTVILNNFSALMKNQKSNSPALCAVGKKSKRSNSAAIFGVDKKLKSDTLCGVDIN